MTLRLFLWVTLNSSLLLCSLLAASGPESISAEEAFKKGAVLLEKRKAAEAIAYFRRAEREFSDNPNVQWNLGLALAAEGRHKEALQTWQKYRELDPLSWHARAKIIQAHHALGRYQARDAEIEALLKMWKNSADAKFREVTKFCREQTKIAGREVMGFQYFEPHGKHRKYYRFSVLKDTGEEEFFISLGSYEITNSIARELEVIPDKAGLYHLDKYVGNEHWTYSFYQHLPSYDEVRTEVVLILTGKKAPISGSSMPRQEPR